jgi:hypothetical protein
MRTNKLLVFAALAGLLGVSPASGQTISLGAVAGGSLTPGFRSASYHFSGGLLPTGEMTSSTFFVTSGRNFIIGPKLELTLSKGLSVEADALYRRMRATTAVVMSPPIQLPSGISINSYAFTFTRSSWEFPLLAKYRFARSRMNPFFELGPSFRPASKGSGLSHYGICAGAGLEMRLWNLNIAPAARYTRWSYKPVFLPEPNLNQFELLVGISQPAASDRVSGFGRKLSFGLIGGLGLGADLRTVSYPGFMEDPDSNTYIVGASIEFDILKSLSVEVDGLYRPLHARDVSIMPDGSRHEGVRFTVLTWEFPMLAKYRFAFRGLKPFLELGPSVRATGNLQGPSPSHIGITGGAGVETRLGKLKISPTLRYTRWAMDREGAGGSRTIPNRAEILLAFSF